jgi:hypothetical protein
MVSICLVGVVARHCVHMVGQVLESCREEMLRAVDVSVVCSQADLCKGKGSCTKQDDCFGNGGNPRRPKRGVTRCGKEVGDNGTYR